MTPYDDYDDDEAHWQQFGRQHAHSTSTQPPTVLDGLNWAEQGSAGRQVLASLVARSPKQLWLHSLETFPGGHRFMAARHKRKLRQVLGQLLDETVRPRSQVGFCHLHVQFVDNLSQPSPSSSICLLLLVQIAS